MIQAAHFTSRVDAGAAGTGAGSVLAILRQAPLIKYSIGTGISTAFCIGFYGCKRALLLSHASRIGVRRVLNISACCLILHCLQTPYALPHRLLSETGYPIQCTVVDEMLQHSALTCSVA